MLTSYMIIIITVSRIGVEVSHRAMTLIVRYLKPDRVEMLNSIYSSLLGTKLVKIILASVLYSCGWFYTFQHAQQKQG